MLPWSRPIIPTAPLSLDDLGRLQRLVVAHRVGARFGVDGTRACLRLLERLEFARWRLIRAGRLPGPT